MSDERYDLDTRPETYWPDAPTDEHRIGRINGLVRRRRVKERLGAGEELNEESLRPTLDDDERELRSSIHPLLMGGEYLPEADEDAAEVEIARIELLSVTGDVYSIRARPDGDRIAYRMVDEYGNEYELDPSDTPLSARELIARIDAVDLGVGGPTTVPECFLDMNLEGGSDVGELRGFVTVTSPFLPDLEPYYASRADAFLDRAPDDDRDGGTA